MTRNRILGLLLLLNSTWAFGEEVEIHVQVCPNNGNTLTKALDLATIDSEDSAVFYLDTGKKTLYGENTILRLRRGSKGDATIKITGLKASEVGDAWLEDEGVDCQADYYGKEVRYACALKEKVSGKDIKEALKDKDFKYLFSDEQIRFAKKYGASKIPWKKLKAFGPSHMERWEVEFEWLTDTLDVEMWKLPNGTEVQELATKTDKDYWKETQGDLEELAQELSLPLCPKPISKTKQALGLVD